MCINVNAARRTLCASIGARASTRFAGTAAEETMSDLARESRIFVAGHRGLVGSAIVRRLAAEGVRAGPDRDPRAARPARSDGGQLLVPGQPARVRVPRGGHGRRHHRQLHRPAEFIYDNMMIHATVVHAAHRFEVTKLLYLGSSCIYPRECAQPMTRGGPALRARSSRPTSPTPSPRSPASSCARPTGGSTGATSSRRCPRISTGPTTTSI